MCSSNAKSNTTFDPQPPPIILASSQSSMTVVQARNFGFVVLGGFIALLVGSPILYYAFHKYRANVRVREKENDIEMGRLRAHAEALFRSNAERDILQGQNNVLERALTEEAQRRQEEWRRRKDVEATLESERVVRINSERRLGTMESYVAATRARCDALLGRQRELEVALEAGFRRGSAWRSGLRKGTESRVVNGYFGT